MWTRVEAGRPGRKIWSAQGTSDLKREMGDGEKLTDSVYTLDVLPKGNDANQQEWGGRGRQPVWLPGGYPCLQ